MIPQRTQDLSREYTKLEDPMTSEGQVWSPLRLVSSMDQLEFK